MPDIVRNMVLQSHYRKKHHLLRMPRDKRKNIPECLETVSP